MPGLATTILVFVSAHAISEFMPSGRIPRNYEMNGSAADYMKRGLFSYCLVILLASFAHPPWLVSLRYQVAALALASAHQLHHKLERLLEWQANTRMLVLDQMLHVAAIMAAAMLIVRGSAAELQGWLYRARWHRDDVLAILAVYTIVLFGGGIFIRQAMRPLLRGLDEGEGAQQLENAGMYIGWLERFLVVTALVLQSPTTIGLILTAKSVVRFPELKSFRFAEYFLVGTLLSLSFAVAGGLVLAAALH
jgi:hypothetical protein